MIAPAKYVLLYFANNARRQSLRSPIIISLNSDHNSLGDASVLGCVSHTIGEQRPRYKWNNPWVKKKKKNTL